MPYEIVWLPEVVGDVARLKDFIEEKNPQATQRASSRLTEEAKILGENPIIGKPVSYLKSGMLWDGLSL